MVNNDIPIINWPSHRITINHREIKDWIESHKGQPIIFEDVEAKGDKPAIGIRFANENLKEWMQEAVEIKNARWTDFFKIFEKEKLAFAFRIKEEPKDLTLAFKFIKREAVLGDLSLER